MKPITIQEFVKSFTQTPPSTTPSKFITSNHTPLEPARNSLEEKIGVRLPSDKTEVINNEFINNPQKAMNILHANTASPEVLQRVHEAVKIHETITGNQIFLRAQLVKPSPPISVRPTKPWLPKVWPDVKDD